MARRNLDERLVRKIGKTGGGKSYTITLPIEIVRSLKWREKQKIVVEQRGDTVILRDWKK